MNLLHRISTFVLHHFAVSFMCSSSPASIVLQNVFFLLFANSCIARKEYVNSLFDGFDYSLFNLLISIIHFFNAHTENTLLKCSVELFSTQIFMNNNCTYSI